MCLNRYLQFYKINIYKFWQPLFHHKRMIPKNYSHPPKEEEDQHSIALNGGEIKNQANYPDFQHIHQPTLADG